MDLQKEMQICSKEFEERWNVFCETYGSGHNKIVAKYFFFSSWQQAKAWVVPEWFDYTKQSPQMDGNYQIFIKGEQITAKWVSRFGFVDPIEGDALRQELITHWAMQPQSPKAQEPTK